MGRLNVSVQWIDLPSQNRLHFARWRRSILSLCVSVVIKRYQKILEIPQEFITDRQNTSSLAFLDNLSLFLFSYHRRLKARLFFPSVSWFQAGSAAHCRLTCVHSKRFFFLIVLGACYFSSEPHSRLTRAIKHDLPALKKIIIKNLESPSSVQQRCVTQYQYDGITSTD